MSTILRANMNGAMDQFCQAPIQASNMVDYLNYCELIQNYSKVIGNQKTHQPTKKYSVSTKKYGTFQS